MVNPIEHVSERQVPPSVLHAVRQNRVVESAPPRAREIVERIRRKQAEMSTEPPVAVRVATETVRQWRDACRAESGATGGSAESGTGAPDAVR